MKQQTPRNIEVQRKQELLNRIAPGLLTWYDKSRRSLPWREEPTPYRVWVSEIMLQQTRVEAVKPYFARFMERLPDIEALAEVDDDELLKLWEGLGYYSRARNLKAAAQQIVTEYGGEMPSDYRELLKLKGIGSYTAGAVSSIAFKQPNPAKRCTEVQQLSVAGILPCRIAWHLAAVSAKGSQKGKDDRR